MTRVPVGEKKVNRYALGRSALGEKKVTDFPEISQKSEGLGLELVSRNLTLTQQKDRSGPSGEVIILGCAGVLGKSEFGVII